MTHKMVKYASPILPHVHLRWDENGDEHYLALGYRDARAVGACAVLEMPNTRPALIDEKSIAKRMALVESRYTWNGIRHGIHVGLTNDRTQVAEAFKIAKERRFGMNSVKAYWVDSTGNMGIKDTRYQRDIWKLAAAMDFRGVFMQHCEDEDYFVGEFDFRNPMSHSMKQNPGAEIVQVMRQYRNAFDSRFRGTFYVCHVSNPDTVEFLDSEKKRGSPFEIVTETIPNHELLDAEEVYAIHGNRAKRNPPLRDEKRRKRLFEYVLAGRTDIWGDDHAPHPLEKKDSENPPSGDPSILSLPLRAKIFLREGISRSQLDRLVFGTANRIFFDGKLPEKEVEVEYHPELWNEYGWNPFSTVRLQDYGKR